MSLGVDTTTEASGVDGEGEEAAALQHVYAEGEIPDVAGDDGGDEEHAQHRTASEQAYDTDEAHDEPHRELAMVSSQRRFHFSGEPLPVLKEILQGKLGGPKACLRAFLDIWHQATVRRGTHGARTFISQGYWDRVLTLVKPGDFVMMEFGHNDASPVNDTLRARGVLPGIGSDSVVIDNLITKQKGEVVYSFGEYLRKFVRETRARGATPIINSLTPRKFWENGRIRRTRDSFADWAEQAAREQQVPFVNLTELASRMMDTMPPARVDSLFGDANLHSSARGAELNARAVVDGLRALGAANPLREYLRP